MQQIAVIGSGVAGLGAAWALASRHDITVFEAGAQAGGHAHTVDVTQNGRTRAVDTGFLVYNEATYPHLIKLFEHLGVVTASSDMSFGVSADGGRFEYTGSARGLLAQKTNALRPGFWWLIRDTLRFFKQAPQWLADHPDSEISLGEYLTHHRYSRSFVNYHLAPMAAAIWSCPDRQVLDFPAVSVMRFFANHGLLQLKDRPQWRTVSGGSREYVRAMTARFETRLHLNSPVTALRRRPEGVEVTTPHGTQHFDAVVVATHADQARRILGATASPLETALLGAFNYTANDAWLHTDPALMPRRRQVWSSWNYLGGRDGENAGAPADLAVTYWLNRLQDLAAPDIFVTLNPKRAPDADKVLARMTYEHPVFDGPAIQAQARLPEIQGIDRIWYCGSYFGYGFHEDGLESGFAVAESLGSPVPWAGAVKAASPAARTARPLASGLAAAAE